MFRLLLVSGLAALAQTQCPTTSSPGGCPTTSSPGGCPTTSSPGGCPTTISPCPGSCKSVSTIPRPLSAIAAQQPIFYYMLPNIAQFNNVDNICVSMFPCPDGPETFNVYTSWVYTNGSTRIASYIGMSISTGVNSWYSPVLSFVNYVMGLTSCGAYVKYRCRVTGDDTDYVVVMGPGIEGSVSALNSTCQQEAIQIIQANGLSSDNMYVLPYKLPTQCVVQQLCLDPKNPLYCRQGGACKPYNATSSCT